MNESLIDTNKGRKVPIRFLLKRTTIIANISNKIIADYNRIGSLELTALKLHLFIIYI